MPIRYGQAEPWKVIAHYIGRTKPSRAPQPQDEKRRKNDGRPPDTAKELLKGTKRTKKKNGNGTVRESKIGHVSYPWSDNSCWLDSSMELLFVALSRDFTGYSTQMEGISPELVLSLVFRAFDLRHTRERSGANHSDSDKQEASKLLSDHRDGIRSLLFERRLIKRTSNFSSAFVSYFPPCLSDLLSNLTAYVQMKGWFDGILRQSFLDNTAPSYFKTLHIILKWCTGGSKVTNHFQVPTRFTQRSSLSLRQVDHHEFGGSIKKWLRNKFTVNQTPTPCMTCYRVREGKALCDGVCTEVEFYISLPVVLIFEFPDPESDDPWDFPVTLPPSTSKAVTDNGLVYDLVGRVLWSRLESHFITRYTVGGKGIYGYDGRENSGYSMRVKGAKLETHLAGKDIDTPPGFVTHAVVYHLRGGHTAQATFYHDQLAAAQRLYHLKFSSSNLDLLPDISDVRVGKSVTQVPNGDRFWLKDPYSKRTIDYIPMDAPANVSPTKKLPASNQVILSEGEDEVEVESLHASDQVILLEGEDELEVDKSPHAGHQVILSEGEDEVEVKSPPLTVAPLSDYGSSVFGFACRCGASGDDVEGLGNGEPIIQCDTCMKWSHIACQIDGRAANIGKKDKYECDEHYFTKRPKMWVNHIQTPILIDTVLQSYYSIHYKAIQPSTVSYF